MLSPSEVTFQIDFSIASVRPVNTFPILPPEAAALPHRPIVSLSTALGRLTMPGYTPLGELNDRHHLLDPEMVKRLHAYFAEIVANPQTPYTSGEFVRRLMDWQYALGPRAPQYFTRITHTPAVGDACVVGAPNVEPYYCYSLGIGDGRNEGDYLGVSHPDGRLAIFTAGSVLQALGTNAEMGTVEPTQRHLSGEPPTGRLPHGRPPALPESSP